MSLLEKYNVGSLSLIRKYVHPAILINIYSILLEEKEHFCELI